MTYISQMDGPREKARKKQLDYLDRLVEMTGKDLTAVATGAGLAGSTLTRFRNLNPKNILSGLTLAMLEYEYEIPYLPTIDEKKLSEILVRIPGLFNRRAVSSDLDDITRVAAKCYEIAVRRAHPNFDQIVDSVVSAFRPPARNQ